MADFFEQLKATPGPTLTTPAPGAPTAAAPAPTTATPSSSSIPAPTSGDNFFEGLKASQTAPQLTATQPKTGLLNGIGQFISETVNSPVTLLHGAQQDVSAFVNLVKVNGLTNAVRAWGAEFRAKAGIPVSQTEEQSLANDIKTYRSIHGADPEILRSLDNTMDNKMTPDQLKEMDRGLVNIGSFLLPAGRFAKFAASPIKNIVLNKIAQAEIHSIASAVSWMGATAAVDEKPVLPAMAQGAAIGAVLPGAGAVAGKVAGSAAQVVGVAGEQAIRHVKLYAAATDFLNNWWDRFAQVGESRLRSVGLGPLADNLVAARSTIFMKAGVWDTRVKRALVDLDQNDRNLVGRLLHGEDPFSQVTVEGQPAIPLPQNELLKITKTAPERLQAAAGEIKSVLLRVGSLLEQAGVPVMDPGTDSLHRFVLRKDFGMPHIYADTQQFITPGPMRDKALEVLMGPQNKMTQSGAETFLEKFHARNMGEIDQIVTQNGRRVIGSVNMMGRRYNLPGYSTDPAAVLPGYLLDAAKKIENFTRFGPARDPVTGALPELPSTLIARTAFPRAFEQVDQIGDEALRQQSEAIVARQLGFQVGGARPLEDKKILSAILGAQAVMKLGLSQITQVSQFITPLAQTGYRDSFKDLIKLMSSSPEAQDRMAQTGAFLHTLVREAEVQLGAGGGMGSEAALRRSGFTWMDTQARRYGVLRGWSMAAHQAEEMTTLLLRQPNAKGFELQYINKQLGKIATKFSDLGIDPKKIISNGGTLDPTDMLKAGQTLSTNWNFWGDSLSLPPWMQSDWGRFLTQFKSFSLQQSTVFKNFVLKPALKDGDLTPLIRMLPSSIAGGELIQDLKSTLRNKPRQTAGAARILENLFALGTFGILGDTFQSTTDPGKVLSAAFGPTVSDAAQITYDVGQAVRGNLRPLGKSAVSMGVPFIPFVGPTIAPAVTNTLFPPKGAKP